MNQCPHCNAELSVSGTLMLNCPKCGGSLNAGPEDVAQQEQASSTKQQKKKKDSTAETIDIRVAKPVHAGNREPTSDSASMRALARPRKPSPQHEKSVQRRLAATYDMEKLSGRSLATIRQDESGADTAKQDIRSSSAWTGGGIESQAQIGFASTYELDREVGRGGMGQIWKARQESLQRDVALKIPYPPDANLDEGSRRQKRHRIERQFVSEVLVTAQLDHPNIVPVYEMGKNDDGTPILAMKLLAGAAWDHSIEGNSEDENLEILLKTCDAIAFAHAQQVVHLDLKPENVWVGEYGEVFVMDWGVAVRYQPNEEIPVAVEGSDWNVAAHGLPGLTPAYAAPEMLDSPPRKIGPTTDVYLLGAVLYEAMTGSAPHAFTGKPMSDAMKAWRNEIVPTEVSSGLIDISLKAMATEPEDRYQTVREFQDALKQYATNKESRLLAETAKQDLEGAQGYGDYQSSVSSFENALRLWPENKVAVKGVQQARFAYAEAAKKNQDFDLGLSILRDESQDEPLIKELVYLKSKRDAQTRNLRLTRWLLSGLVLAFLAGTLFFSVWISKQNTRNIELKLAAETEARRAKRNQEAAEKNLQLAIENERKAKENETRANQKTEEARKAEEVAERQKDLADMAAMLASQRAEENAELARRNSEIAHRARESELEAERQKSEALQTSYRSRIQYAAEAIQQNGFDIGRDILDQLEAQPVQSKLRHWEWGHLHDISHDRRVVDFLTADKKYLPPVEAVSMAGEIVVAGAEDGTIFIWNRNLRTVATAKHGSSIYAIDVSSDGKQIASAGIDENGGYDIRIWSQEGKPSKRLKGHRGRVLGLTYSEDNTELLSASADNTARLWNLATTKTVGVLRGHQDDVRSARFSPDGQWIVTASDDRFVHVWSRTKYSVVKRFVGHEGPVYDAAFTAEGHSIVSGGEDRRLLRWSEVPKAGEAQQYLQAHVKQVEEAIEERGDRTVREFEIMGRHAATITSISCTSDAIFSSSHDNTVRVWDPKKATLKKTLRGHGRWVQDCRGSENGSMVLSAGYDGRVRLWDWRKHEMPKVLAAAGDGERPADRRLQALAQSSDGRWIATGSTGGELMIWDLAGAGGVQAQRLRQGHDWLATDGQYFDQGSRLLTTGGDNKAIVWDARRGTQLMQFGKGWSAKGGIGWYGVASVSEDGRLIVTGSDDPTTPVKLWNAKTGAATWPATTLNSVRRALRGTRAITFAAFSPNSHRILVGDDGGRAFLLATSNGELQQTFTGHTKKVNAGVFSPDGRFVHTASSDGTVRTWSTVRGDQVDIKTSSQPITALATSKDGRYLIVGTRSDASEDATGTIAQWWEVANDSTPVQTLSMGDLAAAHPNLRLEGGEVNVRSVKFGIDSTQALVTTYVRLGGRRRHLVGGWSTKAGYESVLPKSGHGGVAEISSASFVPQLDQEEEAKILVVGGKGARVLTKNTATIVRSYQHTRSITSMAFAQNNQTLAIGSASGSLTVWRLHGDTWKPIDNSWPNAHSGGITRLLFDPKAEQLLSAGRDGKIKVWTLNTDSAETNLVAEYLAHEGPVWDLAYSPLSGKLFSIGNDQAGVVWTLNDGLEEVRRISVGKATCADITLGGQWIATGIGNQVEIWDATTGASAGTLVGHSAKINTVRFSHDGLRVLTAAADTTIRLWDTRGLASGKPSSTFDELLPLESHRGSVTAAQFDPLGQRIISAGVDGETIIWSAENMATSLIAMQSNINHSILENDAPLSLTKDVQIVCPTITNLENAVISARIVGGDDNDSLAETLDADLPEGFNFKEKHARQLIIQRDPTLASPTTIREYLALYQAWQRALHAITYRFSVLHESADQQEVTIERQFELRLDGARHLNAPEENQAIPPSTEIIKVQATRMLD